MATNDLKYDMSMRRIFLIVVSIIGMFPLLYSQEKHPPFGLSLEISSKYMWRGIEYGTAPIVFPMLTFEYKGFNVFTLGAYAFDGSHQEVDLGISYSYKKITFGLSDYYYPSAVGEKDSYFQLSNRSTGHSAEAYLILVPFETSLWLTLSTYIFGADKKLNGDQAFSSYAEVGYTSNFGDSNNLSLALGASLNKSFYTDYEKGFNVVNIALKYTTRFAFGKFKLPVSASYVLNPYRGKSYITFSLYFKS